MYNEFGIESLSYLEKEHQFTLDVCKELGIEYKVVDENLGRLLIEEMFSYGCTVKEVAQEYKKQF